MDGIEVIKEVRKDSNFNPSLVGHDWDMDKIQGLITEHDYVTKPFNPLEIMARVKSLLRRLKITTTTEPDILTLTVNDQ